MHFNNWSIDQKVYQARPGGSSSLAMLLAERAVPKVAAPRYLTALANVFLLPPFLGRRHAYVPEREKLWRTDRCRRPAGQPAERPHGVTEHNNVEFLSRWICRMVSRTLESGFRSATFQKDDSESRLNRLFHPQLRRNRVKRCLLGIAARVRKTCHPLPSCDLQLRTKADRYVWNVVDINIISIRRGREGMTGERVGRSVGRSVG